MQLSMDKGVWQLRSKPRCWASLIQQFVTVAKNKRCSSASPWSPSQPGCTAATASEQKYSLSRTEPKAQQSQGPGKKEQQLLLHHDAAATKNLLKLCHLARYWALLQNQIMQSLSFTNISNTWTFYSLHTSWERYVPIHYICLKQLITNE